MPATCQQCGASSDPDDRFCARCGAALRASLGAPSDPLLGRTIGGAYTLQELIGVGGMGRVYRAEQMALGRTVAIKVIHPHLLGDQQIVARFYNEARAASCLNHPNSVSIIDFGRADDGILYLAMEHLDGKNLALVVHEHGALALTRVCRILDGVLGALGEAHALGVVHRDLKPENVIMKPLRSGGDLVKVVDFGLATILEGDGRTSVTAAGMVCGTPDYMPPEQGRGDPVDGRGDVYALGVVLFELITHRLPFQDETPTRVVLRHINDPVPDPATVAPHRNIPPDLAAIAMRAMAKSPDDRFQTAEEMQVALRRVLDGLKTTQRRNVTCGACGQPSAAGMRFCGSCGARLNQSGRETLTRSLSPAPSSYRPPRTSDRPFVGRDVELQELESYRARAMDGPIWVHVTGEQGVGRTRLLNELAARAAEGGDVVIGAGPHPSRAPVAYHAIRTLVSSMLDVNPAELGTTANDDRIFTTPLARAGAQELAQPVGLAGYDDRGRTGAVAEALAVVVRLAVNRAGAKPLLLVIDDLDGCESLTMEVVGRLPELLAGLPVMLASSGPTGSAAEGAHELPLLGLDLNAAGRFLSHEEDDGRKKTVISGRFMLPLYLEQIEALGANGGEVAPPRLADAVAQRIDRLDAEARRLLQAIAVLGDRCSLEQLHGMEDDEHVTAIERLHDHQLVRVTGSEAEIAHPFVRELVHASIPAEARRMLHRRALALATDAGAPLEVRAEHAFRGDEPMGALMLLERMGDHSRRRGDAATAVLAYRRALDLARREVLESGDPMLEGAILTFSRKLGEALERSGDVVGADGVLREVVDLAGPASAERALMLLALGRVAARRGRHREAVRQLGLALELAGQREDASLQARIQLALAQARRDEGDLEAAASAYARALERGATDPRETIRGTLDHAAVLEQLDRLADATKMLERTRDDAETAQLPALAAVAAGGLARLAERRGAQREAAGWYREAARLSAEAGDAEAHAGWRRAADSLGSASVVA